MGPFDGFSQALPQLQRATLGGLSYCLHILPDRPASLGTDLAGRLQMPWVCLQSQTTRPACSCSPAVPDTQHVLCRPHPADVEHAHQAEEVQQFMSLPLSGTTSGGDVLSGALTVGSCSLMFSAE